MTLGSRGISFRLLAYYKNICIIIGFMYVHLTCEVPPGRSSFYLIWSYFVGKKWSKCPEISILLLLAGIPWIYRLFNRWKEGYNNAKVSKNLTVQVVHLTCEVPWWVEPSFLKFKSDQESTIVQSISGEKNWDMITVSL